MSNVAALIVFNCFFLFQLLFAQEIHIPPQNHPDVNNWNDLFTSDLSNANYQEGIWTFKNEILTASEDKVIWTKKSYDNFILDLEFMTEEGSNSGIFVYCSNIKIKEIE